MNDSSSAAALRGSARQSLIRDSWPSILVSVLVAVAAVFSFSERPEPEFPQTQVYPDRVLVNGLARQGQRVVAVGELGQILVADDAKGPWRSAKLEPQQGLTLTRAIFAGDGVVVAVGHDGLIARSSDRGETWKQVALGGEGSDPLLGLAGPYDGRLYAFGAFGLYLISDDLGQTWQQRELVIDEGGAAQAAAAEVIDPNADPFANFDAEAVGGAGHLNDMTQTADGSLILVGERGLLLRSTDKGETWKKLGDVYSGSFYGVVALPDKSLVAYGMRGNVFYSRDAGTSWNRAKVPLQQSLFAGAVGPGGEAILGGAGNTVLVSTDGGATFTLSAVKARNAIAGLLPLAKGEWLTVGDGGIRTEREAKGVVPEQPETAAGEGE
ncbi:MAG: hypothetical protein WC809_17630 [Sinimarinibacterium sp.]|jgi:photosystem II stability/assembly factor-like uncharacterized protein